MLYNWRIWLFGAYSLAELAIVFAAPTTADSVPNFVGALLFILFGQLPILLLCLIRGPKWALGIGALVFGGLGLWVYFDTIYLAPPDAQSALVFVLVPFCQLVASLVWIIIVHLVSAFARRTSHDR